MSDLTKAATLLANAARDKLVDAHPEGETVVFTIEGVRYCAVVEYDED